jgi:hypothetical protein
MPSIGSSAAPLIDRNRLTDAMGGSVICSPRPQGVVLFSAMDNDDEMMMQMLMKEEAAFVKTIIDPTT